MYPYRSGLPFTLQLTRLFQVMTTAAAAGVCGSDYDKNYGGIFFSFVVVMSLASTELKRSSHWNFPSRRIFLLVYETSTTPSMDSRGWGALDQPSFIPSLILVSTNGNGIRRGGLRDSFLVSQ